MAAPASSPRTELLRARLAALEALAKRCAEASGKRTAAVPGAEEGAAVRVRLAKSRVTWELGRRLWVERLRAEGGAALAEAREQGKRIRRIDAELARLRETLLATCASRPLGTSDVPAKDRRKHDEAMARREEARLRHEKALTEWRKRKREQDFLARERSLVAVRELPDRSDIADGSVPHVPTEAEERDERRWRDEEARAALAREVVRAGGSGAEVDRELVIRELARLPLHELARLRDQGTVVVACRGSVVDHRPDLKRARPLGWPRGSSWEEVPGAFAADRNEVIVATRGHGRPGGPRVPVTGESHGSASLVVHEAMHALDCASTGRRSSAPGFLKAREADRDRLPPFEAFPGDDAAGREETWAESAARFLARFGAGETASLNAYWEAGPVEEPKGPKEPASPAPGAVGVCRMLTQEILVVDLRATDACGLVGDARLWVAGSDPRHGLFLRKVGGLAPGESKPVPPWPERR